MYHITSTDEIKEVISRQYIILYRNFQETYSNLFLQIIWIQTIHFNDMPYFRRNLVNYQQFLRISMNFLLRPENFFTFPWIPEFSFTTSENSFTIPWIPETSCKYLFVSTLNNSYMNLYFHQSPCIVLFNFHYCLWPKKGHLEKSK